MKRKAGLCFLWAIIVFSGLACESPLTESRQNSTNIMDKSEIKLPKTIEDFVKAVNDGDNERFLAFFDKEKGVINDWGRKFVGHEAIKSWSDKEFIGAKGKMTPTKIEQKDDEYRLFADWKSSFYSGASLFIFILEGEKIKEMRIESAN